MAQVHRGGIDAAAEDALEQEEEQGDDDAADELRGDEERPLRLGRAAGILSHAPIWIDDTPAITLLEMRSKARRLRADSGVGLVIVDYLQLMQGPANSESRQQEVSQISRGLKALAKELNVPIVALSQLSRQVVDRVEQLARPVHGFLKGREVAA